MIVNLWTVTVDGMNGTSTDPFTTQEAAEAGARAAIEECWNEHWKGKTFPDDHWAALAKLSETVGFMDSVTMAKHDIEVPVIQGQFEYELRACLHDKEDGTIDSFETVEMRDKHFEGVSSGLNPGEWERFFGMYRRPLVGDAGGIRALKHVADFEDEDEAKAILELIAAKPTPVPAQKIEVWTMATDDDDGMTLRSFPSEEECFRAMWEYVARHEGGTESEIVERLHKLQDQFPGDIYGAWDTIVGGSLDTLHHDSMEITIPGPAPAAQKAVIDELQAHAAVFANCEVIDESGDPNTLSLAEIKAAGTAMLDLIDGINTAAPAPTQKKFTHLGIKVEGGVVQSVWSDDPIDSLPHVYIIDHDTEGHADMELFDVNGDKALVSDVTIDTYGSPELWNELNEFLDAREEGSDPEPTLGIE